MVIVWIEVVCPKSTDIIIFFCFPVSQSMPLAIWPLRAHVCYNFVLGTKRQIKLMQMCTHYLFLRSVRMDLLYLWVYFGGQSGGVVVLQWLGDTSLLPSLLSYDCPRLCKRLFRKAT